MLIQYSLIKIGQVPLWIVGYLFKFRLPKISFPHYTLYPIPYTLSRLRRGRGRPRKFWRRMSRKTKIAVALSLGLLLLYVYTSFIVTTAYQLPSPKKLVSTDKALTTEFFDRKGKLLYRLYEGRNRTLVGLNELPSYVAQATISTEDKNFYHHLGIDPLAIIRAGVSNLKNNPQNNQLEGASTITQQLIKNTLLTPEKTYTRKIKELILALWAERLYSKDEILQMYLNEAPYGGPAWGIEAASQTYFGINSRQLTLAQAAYLAGLPASPTQFSPYGTNPELGKDRQREVLQSMKENKFLTEAQANQALAEDLHLKPQITNIYAPHFVMYIKDLLSAKYGQRVLSQGGLKITTTLDLTLQETVEKAVSEEVEKLAGLNVKNGAAMVTDARSGQILAMVGSKDYHERQFGSFNVALALRQPGSAIKVATYATAFKQGFTPGTTILDIPVSFKDGVNVYSPVNYDGRFHGPVSIRTALGSSYNIPAVKMLATIGIDNMIKTARDLGITTFNDPKRYGLSLTLGGGEVKMIDMMTVYGTLAQMGQKREATPILKVTDSDGNVLEEYQQDGTQALEAPIAYLVTSILTDNSARTPAFGSNSLLKISGHSVAVKTGTSDNKRDNWTFGYSPEFVVGVWVGNNDNSPMNPALTSGITGAAPIWNKIMKGVLEGRQDVAFERPEGIIEATIDGRRDLAVAGIIPKGLVRIRKEAEKTIFSDAFSTFATPSAITSAKNEPAN
ncbi:MAG: 1A family penicillin-binding protein [Microgenomates group bacterium Gr01-1014_7]|nr:MAG: 1A family penicillin-binding protein [Microgenomates group bacterium Gr01-1014_7]